MHGNKVQERLTSLMSQRYVLTRLGEGARKNVRDIC